MRKLKQAGLVASKSVGALGLVEKIEGLKLRMEETVEL